MPIGLDGNPHPVSSAARAGLLDGLVADALSLEGDFVCVAVDGVAGSGKSTFGDELAERVRSAGRPVYRSTTDSFHNPRAVRHRSDVTPAEAYFSWSHNIDAIQGVLLDPFLAGWPFRVAVFDEPSDQPVQVEKVTAVPGSVLIFDGLFLLRPELRRFWSMSVFLEADRRVEAMFEEWSSGAEATRVEAYRARYERGWQLYLERCSPRELADAVVNNDVFEEPSLVRRGSSG